MVPPPRGLTDFPLCHDLQAYHRIVAHFGPSVLRPDGSIDRVALGDKVFSDAGARQVVNKATHSAVAWELLSQLSALFAAGTELVVIDAALLFESGLHHACAEVLCAQLDPEQQIARLMARDGLRLDQARARVAAQMPPEQKVARADVVIATGVSREETRDQVLSWVAAQDMRCGAGPSSWPWLGLPEASGLLASVTLYVALAALRAARVFA